MVGCRRQAHQAATKGATDLAVDFAALKQKGYQHFFKGSSLCVSDGDKKRLCNRGQAKKFMPRVV